MCGPTFPSFLNLHHVKTFAEDLEQIPQSKQALGKQAAFCDPIYFWMRTAVISQVQPRKAGIACVSTRGSPWTLMCCQTVLLPKQSNYLFASDENPVFDVSPDLC